MQGKAKRIRLASAPRGRGVTSAVALAAGAAAERRRVSGERDPEVENVRFITNGATPEECGWRTTWEELLSRVIGSLDVEGIEGLEKSRQRADKIRRLNPRAGEGVDVAGVGRALAAYYDGQLDNGRKMPLKLVFGVCGVRISDLFDSYGLHPEFKLAMDYIERTRGCVAEMYADELKVDALKMQKRLLTEDGCKGNQRAVELQLKSTMRKVYGEEDGGRRGRTEDRRGGITYSFPNMKMNWIVAPGAQIVSGSEVLEGRAVRESGGVEAGRVEMGEVVEGEIIGGE